MSEHTAMVTRGGTLDSKMERTQQHGGAQHAFLSKRKTNWMLEAQTFTSRILELRSLSSGEDGAVFVPRGTTRAPEGVGTGDSGVATWRKTAQLDLYLTYPTEAISDESTM